MRLSHAAIEEFKTIYREEFGATLSETDAQEMGQRLLRMVQLLARPLPVHAAEDAPRPPSLPIDRVPRPTTIQSSEITRVL